MVPDLMFVMSRDGVYLDYHARNPQDLFVQTGSVPRETDAGHLSARDGSVFRGEVRRRPSIPTNPSLSSIRFPCREGNSTTKRGSLRCDNDTIMTIVRDVTVRHQAEEQLHKAQSELPHASRMRRPRGSGGRHRARGESAAGRHHHERAQRDSGGSTRAPPNSACVREALHDIVADGKRASDVITRIREHGEPGADAPRRRWSSTT